MANLAGSAIHALLFRAPFIINKAEKVQLTETLTLGEAVRDTPDLVRVLAGRRKPAWKGVASAFFNLNKAIMTLDAALKEFDPQDVEADAGAGGPPPPTLAIVPVKPRPLPAVSEVSPVRARVPKPVVIRPDPVAAPPPWKAAFDDAFQDVLKHPFTLFICATYRLAFRGLRYGLPRVIVWTCLLGGFAVIGTICANPRLLAKALIYALQMIPGLLTKFGAAFVEEMGGAFLPVQAATVPAHCVGDSSSGWEPFLSPTPGPSPAFEHAAPAPAATYVQGERMIPTHQAPHATAHSWGPMAAVFFLTYALAPHLAHQPGVGA